MAIAMLAGGCGRLGFDAVESDPELDPLPDVGFDVVQRKISTLHAPATVLRGTCTEIGGAIEVSGDGVGSALCADDGTWSMVIDFSAAPDGLISISGVQWDETGERSSEAVYQDLLKDTAVCTITANADAAPFAAGAGTEADPYRVCTRVQLSAVNDHLDAHVRLENDIDLSDAPWSYLGTLTGSFDGNGFVIENLSYETGSYPSGLFASASGTIENLGVTGVSIWSFCHVGAVVGILNAGGVVRRCWAEGDIASYSDAVGGLVGQNGGTVVDSFSAVEVTDTGSYCIGGLVGINDSTGSVVSSFARGRMAGHGVDRFGGLVGCNDGTVTDAFAIGEVATNTGSTKVGGLVGENTGSVSYTFAAGVVSGGEFSGGTVGGLVGNNTGEVISSYWDLDLTRQAISSGGDGLDAESMAVEESFEGWDFDEVWKLDPDVAPYPQLRWALP